MDKRGFTLVELFVVIAMIAILTSVLLPVLSRSREAGRRAICVSNLKQMAIAFKAYSAESREGKLPPIAAYYDYEVECNNPEYPKGANLSAQCVFFWSPGAMVPDYIADANILVCPSDNGWTPNDLVNQHSGKIDIFQKCAGPRGWNMLNGSYAYMGHVYDKMDSRPEFNISINDFRAGTHLECASAPDDSQIGAQLTAGFLTILRVADQNQATLADSDYDLSGFNGMTPVPLGNGDGNILYRLREGIERVLITDTSNSSARAAAQATIAIMWDQTSTLPSPLGYNHVPGGSNVLFLDGHVDYVHFPGKGPTSVPSAVFSGCLEG